MPCTNCMTPFTRFRKEHGCSSCSFSFCAKCLPQKIVLPQLSKQPVSVCQNCYDKLTQRTAHQIGRVAAGPAYLNTNQQGDYPPPPYVRDPPVRPAHDAPYDISCHQLPAKDEELKNRLDKLKADDDRNQKIPSVNEIEERLARLRGISVEEVRNPSLMFLKNRHDLPKETVERLMEKARAEAMIEKKWDPTTQLQRRYNEYHGIQDQEGIYELEDNFDEKPGVNENATSSTTDADDILFSADTVRNLKELKRTLTDAETASKEASASFVPENKMKDEMEEIMKITRQKSLKNEKINAEMEKFWQRSFEKYSVEDSDSAEDSSVNQVDEAELKKILKEAEQAVEEEKTAVKEAKKQPRRGFFSRIFRSSDS